MSMVSVLGSKWGGLCYSGLPCEGDKEILSKTGKLISQQVPTSHTFYEGYCKHTEVTEMKAEQSIIQTISPNHHLYNFDPLNPTFI